MNNYIYITTMKPHELAAFLRSILDPDEVPEIGCFNCINYGTHHSDPANKGTNLYECEGCPNEDVGFDLEKWLMLKHEPTSDRNLVAISIKHTVHHWVFGKPCCLWGNRRTKDEEKRCFGGYTLYPDEAELYSLADWAKDAKCPWLKVDAPVKLTIDLCKKYKNFDTVLVTLDDYIAYCQFAGLPLTRPNNGG